MLSFVRRLNPFRRSSTPAPPNIVTRSVQADLDSPYPQHSDDSHHTVMINTFNVAKTRRGINTLLREFEKKNFTVATLMDQDGRIFFTIDLTEIINNDEEMNNIVRMVQKSVENMSMQSMTSRSDEMSKKLKRHFLFESIKELDQKQNKMNSSDYYTVPERNTKSQIFRKRADRSANRKTPMKNRRKIDHSSLSIDEKEIKSLLYEASSSMTPEENMKLLESIRSSLATKIYRRIEETIRNIKRKHDLYDEETDGRDSISVTFSRHFEHVPEPIGRKYFDYDKDKQQMQRETDWIPTRDRTKRPQTRRNAEFKRPFIYPSSSSRSIGMQRLGSSCENNGKENFKFSENSPINLRKQDRKPSTKVVEDYAMAYTSVSQPTARTRNILRRDNSRSVKANVQLIKTKKSETPPCRRPATAVDGNRANMLSARRDILEKLKRRVTPNKNVVNFNEKVREAVNPKDNVPKSKDIKKEHKKEKHDRFKVKENNAKQKPTKLEDESNHKKKDERKPKRPDTRKDPRTAQKKSHLDARITDAKDKELIVLYKSAEATREPDRSKGRKSEKKKTKEPEALPVQTGYSSSEECRFHRPKTGKRRHSKKKDNLDEVRSSEAMMAVISFGPYDF